ncbi:AEC family transporter [Bosea sp. (in: a-proteobacteria)]|uniref:AEC family transporter n=1 Tax=Bosea sp. (in: a-proteobacteria) TaxID=1871050 RepID=UPI0027359890|nr:AEC family transporter [Bosea sp. (in: a-proteobacteria)]MDP3409661.1 AEC family transporter [Bosea sp. (in: a-proteobacteria)]
MLSSLIAVFLVIATGWALKARGTVSPAHWLGVERLTYQVLFPAVVIHTLAVADLGALPVLEMGLSLVLAILTVAGLLLACRPLLARAGIDGPAFTSIFQGSVRWNTFIALALAAGLQGRDGTTLMAIAVAAMIPLLNVLCVVVLARFANGRPMSPSATVRSIVFNPFIWSSAVGLALNQMQWMLPAAIVTYLDVMGRAALGVGLLAVGAGLDLRSLARPRLAHCIAVGVKLVVMPLLAWTIARQFGLSGPALTMTVVAASVPTATAAYFLARDLGGDAPLMAEITTLQTLLALATLPLAVLFLG